MKIIVGLGNPGLRYKNTRHNAGFIALSEIAKEYRVRIAKKSYKGKLGVGNAAGEKTIFFMPYIFMNRSGEAVRELLKAECASAKDLLVIYDDIDLDLGLIRLREKGSSAGHKGLQSIIEALGTSDFPRLRVGICNGKKPYDVIDFVLKPFSAKEKKSLKLVIEEVKECVAVYLKEGAGRAMSLYNRTAPPATA